MHLFAIVPPAQRIGHDSITGCPGGRPYLRRHASCMVRWLSQAPRGRGF
jgi:hypothetical protein